MQVGAVGVVHQPIGAGPERLSQAAARKWVVVVLPLVPDTIATRSPASSLASAPGSSSQHHLAPDRGSRSSAVG